MTVQSQSTAVGYTGNGATLVFAYTFRILDATYLKVYFDDVLQVGGYTVDGVGNQLGGNVTFAVAPANGVHVRLQRFTAKTQDVDYTPYDAFPAETHEMALDKLTMLVQEGIQDAENAIKVPADELVNTVLPAAATRANQFVSFDANGNVIVGLPVGGGVPVTPFMQTLLDDTTAIAGRATLGLAIVNKGGLLVGQGASVIAEQAVGANGLALIGDSTLANGVGYKTVFNDSAEVDIAVGATPAIFGALNSVVRLTGGDGTSRITAFDAGALGKIRLVRMQNSGPLLVNSANLVNPIPFDVQLQAGDSFLAEALGGGVTKIHRIIRASGEILKGGFIPFGVFHWGLLNATASATSFMHAGPGMTAPAQEWYGTLVVSEACTISELRMWASAALAGGTAAVTVRKNLADTALTCTLAAASGQSASDVTHSFDADEGDIITIKIVTGAIGAVTDFGVTVVVKQKGLNVGVGTHLSFNSGANALNGPGSMLGNYAVATENLTELSLPACRVQSRACYMASGATVGTLHGGGVRRNAANVHAGGAVASLNMGPLTHIQSTASGELMNPGARGPIFQFVEGDTYNQRGVTTDVDSVNVRHANQVLGATDQQYHHNLIRYQAGDQAQALTRYAAAYSGNAIGALIDAQSATETDVQVPMPACILRGLRVVSNTAVAGGQNCVITVRKNGVDQALTCTLTSAGRFASDLDPTHGIVFAAGDLLSVKVVSSATAGTHTYNITIEINQP